MADSLREPFRNPYVDESVREAKFSAVVTMDEAHERWKKGQWRADKTSFNLDESFLDKTRTPDSQDKPKGNRFAFDLQRDIIDGDIDSSRLDGVAYTASYRPQGIISSNISNLTVNRLKYNALADIKEDIPEDLSFLYGGASNRTASADKRQPKSRSRNRLDAPVEKRRAQVDKMLPERSIESPEKIMADIRRRRDIEDAKSGIVRDTRKPRYRRGIYDVVTQPGSVEEFHDIYEEYCRDEVTERGSWRSDIPVQDGLVPDSREIPYFGRYSRRWSEVDPLNPTRSELLTHTVNTIYDDEPSQDDGHYVPNRDFDPDDRYRPLENQRRQVRAGDNVLHDSIMSGEFNNPYVKISNDRLKKLLNPNMRSPGNLPPPDGLTDPSLLYEWNMGYNRVNASGNRYSEWMAEQSRLAENAEQSRYRGSHRVGRPGAYMQREYPYGEARKYPRREVRQREIRRRDMSEQLQRATEKGIADGREIIRQQQIAQQKQWQQAYAQQQAYYKQQHEQMMKQQQAYAQKQAQAKQQSANRTANAQNPQKKPAAQPAAAQPTANAPRMPRYGEWGYYSPTAQTNVGTGQTKKS